MEKKEHLTLVKRTHEKFGGNDFIRGRISAFNELIADSLYAIEENTYGHIFCSNCTDEVYQKFIEVVEKHYPGLCEFNYVVPEA